MPDEFDFTRYTSRASWEELVSFIILHPVDAILLASDVVDQDDLFFETYHAFENGIRKILDKGIPIIAVSGNHDSAVFRKRVNTITSPHFHLLGKEGKWESVSLTFKSEKSVLRGGLFQSRMLPIILSSAIAMIFHQLIALN